MSGRLRPGRGGRLLALRVTPHASRNGISGLHTAGDGQVSLAIKVTAIPDKGKANRAVIEVLAKAARLPKSAFSIVSGETDRSKTVLVTGDWDALENVIAQLQATGEDEGPWRN